MRAATLFGLLLGLTEHASAKCQLRGPSSNSTLSAPLSSASVHAYATASHSFYSNGTALSNGSHPVSASSSVTLVSTVSSVSASSNSALSAPSSSASVHTYATASHSFYSNGTALSNGSHPVSASSSVTIVSTVSSISASGSGRSSSLSSSSAPFPTITRQPSNFSLSITHSGSSVASSATVSTSSLPDGSYSGYITVQETSPARLARRSLKYVSFNGRLAEALDDASRADLVTFYPNGTVVFTNLFVNGVAAKNQTLLGLSPDAASPYSTWNYDAAGNAILVGSTGFCMDSSSNILVQTAAPSTKDCRPVSLIIVRTLPSASSSLPSATSSVSSSALVPTVSASTTASFTMSGSSITMSSPSITSSGGPLCSATSNAMVAVADSSVDRTSYANLVLSRSASLNYRDPSPGQNAVSVKIDTVYDVVMLENSEYITEVTCGQDEITVKVTDDLAYGLVRGWPQSDFVIITNSAGCNTETQRGSFLVKGHTDDVDESTATFAVASVQWGDISETMTISYGTVAAASANDKPVYSSTCTNTLTATRPSITSSAALPSSTTLSPGAQAMMDYIMKQVVYDPDKNEVLVTTFQNPVDLDGGDGSPVTDPDLLDKLKALMKEDGLPDPDALMDEANNATDSSGTCWTTTSAPPQLCPTATSCAAAGAPTGQSRRRTTGAMPMPNYGSLDLRTGRNVANTDVILMERDTEEDVDEVFEYVCSDWVEILLTPFEKINEIREFVCNLKELYDAGKQLYEVIQCLKNPFCFNPPEIHITITYPPAQRWKYTYGWKASWLGMNGANLVARDAQNYIRCVDCAFSISDLTIDGAITYNVSAKTVTEAHNTVRLSSVARLIMQMQTSGAWQGKGTAFVSSLGLGNQQIDTMFAFSPTVVFTLGAEGNTNAPVSSTGGAVLSFNGASVDLDYNSKTIANGNNFKPAIEMTYPGFRNDAKVNFAPVMTTDVRITMNVLNGVLASTSAVTSELSIGFNATYSEAATDNCGAGQLNLKSYVSARSNAVFDGGARQLIDGTTSNNPIRCLSVPQYFPTNNEISSLKEVGGDFCTSFIGYRAPVTVLYTGTTTSLVASTTTTTTETSTTTVISTYTTTATTSTSLAGSVPYYQFASTVYTQGSDVLQSAYLKRSEPSPAPELVRRDPVATPTLVSGWAADKISYACSQVATGTQTLTRITSVATTYTSTSTATATATQVVGVAGPMQTVTATSTRYIVTALTGTTSTLAGSTNVATACPLQTQAACFRVKTHGHPLIEGQYVGTGVYNGRGHVVAGASIVPDDGVFHLAADGRLVSVRRRAVLQYIDAAQPDRLRPDADYVEGWWAGQAKLFGMYDSFGAQAITQDWSGARPFLANARCDLDCGSGVLTCAGPANATQLYIFDPEGQVADRNYVAGYPNWYPAGFTDLPFRLMWYNAPRNWDMVPVTLKVEEVPCLCAR